MRKNRMAHRGLMFTLGTAALAGAMQPGVALGALEEVFYNGATYVGGGAITPNAYTDVTYKGSGDNYMAARADGGVTEIGFSGAWNMTNYPVGGNVFNAITHKTGDAYNVTLASGGFAEVFWNGSTFVKDSTVNSGVVYNDIEYRGVADAYMLTRAGGGITEISYAGGWNTFDYPVGGNVFTAIAHKTGDSYNAILASGGFAEVFWNGSTFVKDSTVDAGTIYTDIVYRGVGDNYMLTRADGGVTEVGYAGGWNLFDYPVGGTVYNAIAHKSGDSFFAAYNIPEPSSLSVLAIGSLLVGARQRRHAIAK